MQPREKVQEEGEGEGRVQGRRRREGGGGQSSGKEEGRVRERRRGGEGRAEVRGGSAKLVPIVILRLCQEFLGILDMVNLNKGGKGRRGGGVGEEEREREGVR